MTRSGPTTALTILTLFFLAAGAAAQPTYFIDIAYRSLQQLDETLAAGEISVEEYQQLLAAILRECDGSCDHYNDLLADTLLSSSPHSDKDGKLSYELHTRFSQRITKDHSHVRYDRGSISWRNFTLEFSAEHRDNRDLLVRSRTLQINTQVADISLGSFSVKKGNGLTLGYANQQRRLYRRQDFLTSLVSPTKNRHNGLLVDVPMPGMDLTVTRSRLRGEEFRSDVVAAVAETGVAGSTIGLIWLHQSIEGQTISGITDEYLAPYFSWKSCCLRLQGESSFGLETGSAHQYSGRWRSTGVRLDLTFFAYGKEYRNLRTGGYAYADYSTVFLADSSFAYRDKRRGRIGFIYSSSLELSKNSDLRLALTRWRNRIDRRDCAAGRIKLSGKGLLDKRGYSRVSAVWENRDLSGGSDSRRAISVSQSLNLSERANLRVYLRLEKRKRSFLSRQTLRGRFETEIGVSDQMTFSAELNYYDPDLNRGEDSYLYCSIGQILRKDSRVEIDTELRLRADFGPGELAVWEVRMSCDVEMD